MAPLVRVLFISSIHFSQDSTQQFSSHHDVAMDLINSVTGVDEEGRSRQRILSFAAKRFAYITWLNSVSNVTISLHLSERFTCNYLLLPSFKVLLCRYVNAIERNPDDPDAYYNWALVLQVRNYIPFIHVTIWWRNNCDQSIIKILNL